MNKITRKDIVACDWSWTAMNQAKAYRHAITLLHCAGCSGPAVALAETAYKNMMRYHALDAIRIARIYTRPS
jgi:predicted metal-binding protein